MTTPQIPDPLPETDIDTPLYGGDGGRGVLPATFRSRRATTVARDEPWALFRITPSDYDQHPAERARQLVSNLGGIPLALETVAGDGRASFYLRTPQSLAGLVSARFRAVFPHADFEEVPADEDPARTAVAGDAALAVRLGLDPDPAWPLQHLDRLSRADGTSTPPVLAVAGFTNAGERVISRLTLQPAPVKVAQRLAQRVRSAQVAQESARLGKQHYLWQSAMHESLMRLLSGTLIFGGLAGLGFYFRGMYVHLALLIAAAIIAPFIVMYVRDRVFGQGGEMPAQAAQEKLASGPLLAARLELIAIGPPRTDRERLAFLLRETAMLYAAVDHPLGGGLVMTGRPAPPAALPVGPGPGGKPDAYLNPAEAALIWHPPASDPHTQTAGSRYPLPDPVLVGSGCPVGVARYQDKAVPVHMPPSMLQGHQLVVARTGKGKSTLLTHVAQHVMARMAQGREPLSLVVIDPHGDLARDVAALVPPALANRAVYLDLARPDSAVGINLLDRALFPRADLVVEHIVAMLRSLWPDNWGPRMETILRVALGSLHSANQARPLNDQYTLLDVSPFLTNKDFRDEVFKAVPDPGLLTTWHANYDAQNRQTQQASINPVTTKIGRFVLTDSARVLFGQPASTIDPRDLIAQGRPLIVSTSSKELGEGGSELLGATLLNLMAYVVEAQASLDPARRRRIIALVDESATLGAADYQRMLGELRKYGLSMVLVTQSLARLERYSASLKDDIFANVQGLTAFSVSARDAEYLQHEMGDLVTMPDLVNLPDHECYARWHTGGRVIPPFRFRLHPPPAVDHAQAERMAAAAAERYGRPRDEVRSEVNASLAARGGTTTATPISSLLENDEKAAWKERP